MQRLREDHKFDDAAQRQIIALAAELQRAEHEGATLAELEGRAREAGIDPKYVQMAVGHMQPVAQTPPLPMAVPTDAPWYRDNELTILALGAFLIVQMITAQDALGWGGMTSFPGFAFIGTFLMGLTLSRTSTRRLTAVAALAGTFIASMAFRLIVRGFSRRVVGFDVEELALLAMVEGVILLVAFIVSWFFRTVASQLRGSR